jgi:DNA-binding NarL/FixJ family response regulator
MMDSSNATAELPSVLIAEDDEAMRGLLGTMLKRLGYPVAGLAHNGLEAVEKTRELKPGVLLLDIAMPVLNGLEAARMILADSLLPIVVLTGLQDERTLEEARRLGVQAFLLKPLASKEQLRAAITIATTICARQRADAAQIAALSADLQAARTPAPPPPELASYGLTQREMEVVQLVGEGLSNAEIGTRLQLSPRTVEKHVEHILHKVGFKSRAGVARLVGLATRRRRGQR